MNEGEGVADKGKRDSLPIVHQTNAAAHVLVVEDDILIALDIEQMLTDLADVRVTLAHDLATGLRSLEAGWPDMAILDLHLGAHDSLPLARLLAGAGKPFLFLTGHPAEHMCKLRDEKCRAPVVEKPFSIEALAGAVRRMLKRCNP